MGLILLKEFTWATENIYKLKYYILKQFNILVKSNQMLLWKELILSEANPRSQGSSRTTCENSTKRMWWLVMTLSIPSVSPTWSARSLLPILCHLQSLCPALSSGVNHNATARMAASPTSVPYRQPHLVSSTTVV